MGAIKSLDLGHIPFVVKDKGAAGKSYVGVKLKSVSDVDNKEVLSEGEQRALALACFLGEVLGDDVKHGIVVDDPVSSLDHIRIRRVAKRLVQEAATGRQVIIFTHNLLFFSEVMTAAAENNPQVPLLTHYISKDETKGFGIVNENDVPWVAKKVAQRIDILRRQRLPVLKGRTDTDSDEYRRAVKDFYTDLRETWERFVEEILLAGVVERYGSDVKTQSLKGVVVKDEDYQKVYFAMKRVSERSGHDTAVAKMAHTPSFDDMQADLDELDAFRTAIDKRRKDLESERKKLEKPPAAETA